MCGIFGVHGDAPIDRRDFDRSLARLEHRGPDDVGVRIWPDHRVGLGHRRLSIIDLSPAGRNPMPNEDESIWLVFNGEIFNFRELRRELQARGHRFRSQSDSEVIPHAYEEWGDDHVHRLRGMFAYALYDRRRLPRLLLVRDRLGIKPLFYHQSRSRFVFASEIKALLSLPEIDRTVDRTALFDYLTYGYVPPPKTAFVAVRHLPAGHLLAYQGSALAIRQYWDVPLAPDPAPASLPKARELVREAASEATRLSMVSDVPIGIFLSGGIDSSTVAALATQVSTSPLRSFSVDFDVASHSEASYARLIANRYQTLHRERRVTLSLARDLLPRLTEIYDEPFAGSSAVPTFEISVAARKEVKVVLSGDGGDEVFAGYDRYPLWLRRRLVSRWLRRVSLGLLPGLASRWPAAWRGKPLLSSLASAPLAQYAQLVELFPRDAKRSVVTADWRREFVDYDDYWFWRQHWHRDVEPLTRLQYLDLKTYLPGHILTKVDRASMAVSLEVRPPLLDHVLVERIMRLPAAVRAPGGRQKELLKNAVADLLPKQILNRSKKGFSSPLATWLANDREWIEERLRLPAPYMLGRCPLDAPGLFGRRSERIWTLLVLRQWLDSGNGAGT